MQICIGQFVNCHNLFSGGGKTVLIPGRGLPNYRQTVDSDGNIMFLNEDTGKIDFTLPGVKGVVDLSKLPEGFPLNIISTDITSTTNLKKFTWSHGGTYFGNIMTDAGGFADYTEDIPVGDGPFPGDVTRDEGWYVFNTPSGLTYYGNAYSFTNCANQYNLNPRYRSGHGLARGRTTFNGKWNPSWGLYNTIRMVGAERHANNTDIGFTDDFRFSYTFGAGFTFGYTKWSTSQQSCGEAISAYNLAKTPIHFPIQYFLTQSHIKADIS